MSIDIRPWQPGDEAAIRALFHAVFGREMTAAFWRWRFLDHPDGGPLAMLAWEGDRLAAHYGASRAALEIDGERMPAALSMTTMTHPDFRGRGLLQATGEALYETLAAEGCVAALGFPNQAVHAARLAKLGWVDVCDVATMTAPIPGAGGRAAAAQAGPVVEVAQMDARFGRLAARLARPGRVGFARDTATLAWRVDANPVHRYRRLALPDGDEIAGYALLKSWGDTAMDLVELCAESEPAARALLAAAAALATETGATRLHAWRLPRDDWRVAFERAGFVAGAPVTYFGGRLLAGGRGLDDPRRWRLAMIDSDLY